MNPTLSIDHTSIKKKKIKTKYPYQVTRIG